MYYVLPKNELNEKQENKKQHLLRNLKKSIQSKVLRGPEISRI